MKQFISWNVNGIRACVKKGFEQFFHNLNADIFSIQETKLQQGQIELNLNGYYQYWNYAEKKGYSGTAIFTKEKPLNVYYGMGILNLDTEGRLITLEFDDYFFLTVYTPNSQDGLARIGFRIEWETAFREYIKKLDEKKPVIICGDLNCAHNEIDLKHPKENVGNPGFSNEERGEFNKLINIGLVDSFRYFYPDKTDAYSWWSYRSNAREKNVGWRIDYFLVSERMSNKMNDAKIHPEIYGSDHCPVEITLQGI